MLKRIGSLFGNNGRANYTPFVSTALGLTAAAHLNFVDRRYYWNGGERREGDFDTFTGAVFGSGAAAGLTGAGVAANHDITLAWAKLNISVPFVAAVVFRPSELDSVNQTIVCIEAAATPTDNLTRLQIASTNVARNFTTVGAATQASQVSGALSINTNYAQATLLQTNLFRNSLNGATAGAEDVSGSLPTYSLIRFLESPSGTAPFKGAARHVLFFQQTGGAEISQVDLNTLSGEAMTL